MTAPSPAELEGLIERLEKALEPFAKLAELYHPATFQAHEHPPVKYGPTIGDLWRAREALSSPADAGGVNNLADHDEPVPFPEFERTPKVASEADMRAFGASHVACMKWPNDTPEHRLARAAYVEGAADSVPPDLAAMRKAHLLVLDGLLPKLSALATRGLFKYPGKTDPAHLLEMIERAQTIADLGKLARWTGFVQGVMAARGWLNVDEERDRTRPIFAEALSSPADAGGAVERALVCPYCKRRLYTKAPDPVYCGPHYASAGPNAYPAVQMVVAPTASERLNNLADHDEPVPFAEFERAAPASPVASLVAPGGVDLEIKPSSKSDDHGSSDATPKGSKR